jgi:hypothetical protein
MIRSMEPIGVFPLQAKPYDRSHGFPSPTP